MRQFYVYGFKSRLEYTSKSSRSYDNERRRIESWLGDFMRFVRTPEGKNAFLSVDSRVTRKNPFYKAWKAKSFTDGDITLHFAIFDILYDPQVKKTLGELVGEIDELLSSAVTYDESTVRKKLKEYVNEGIIRAQKQGRTLLYSRTPDTDISALGDVIDFASEASPCGVIGSFLQDKQRRGEGVFSFKHHYITQAMDSEAMATLFDAIHGHRYITAENLGKHSDKPRPIRVVPLKIYISAQNGRQNLIAFHENANRLNSYRLDYLSKIRVEDEVCEKYDFLRKKLTSLEKNMWGVNCKWNAKRASHVEFEVEVGENEQYIVNRLEREKRCGKVEKIDDNHYRFTADVFDTNEMFPWIRTFICRITRAEFSDREAEARFKNDIRTMYEMYGIDGGDGNAVQ